MDLLALVVLIVLVVPVVLAVLAVVLVVVLVVLVLVVLLTVLTVLAVLAVLLVLPVLPALPVLPVLVVPPVHIQKGVPTGEILSLLAAAPPPFMHTATPDIASTTLNIVKLATFSPPKKRKSTRIRLVHPENRYTWPTLVRSKACANETVMKKYPRMTCTEWRKR